MSTGVESRGSGERRRWRLGIVGCGEWGPNHVRNFNALPNADVVGVADQRSERLARMQTLAPHVPLFESFDDLLGRADPDAIVIATPTGTHYALARQALLAGKHVLCEKPLCLSPVEADDLVRLAEQQQVRLMVGHVFLFNPGILKLKEIVASHGLGRLFYLAARRTNLGPIRSDVNAVLDLASHDVSIFNFLLDDVPLEVSAVGRSFLQTGVEDVSFITLQYANNVFGSIHVSWLDPRKVRQITAVGEERMATWDDLATLGPVMVFDKGVTRTNAYADFGEFQLLAREGDVSVPRVGREEPLKAQARAFLEYLDGTAACRSDGRMAADVVRVLVAVNESMAKGGAPARVREVPESHHA